MIALSLLSFVLPAVLPAPPTLQEPYREPPPEVVAVVDAAPPPSVQFSPDRQWLLLLEQDAHPSLDDLARPMLRLAGSRIDPHSNGRFATQFVRGISLRPLLGGEPIALPLGDDARIGSVSWSHDSHHFVFTRITEDGTELWGASIQRPDRPRRLASELNTLFGGPRWMPDGKSLLVRLVPEGRGEAPPAPRVPIGPNIQESHGEKSPLRTYQDLLSNPYEADLFEHYATAELAMVDVSGSLIRFSSPAIYSSVSVAPDGKHLLVTRIQRPFSFLHPWSSFPRRISVMDRTGREQFLVADLPLVENVPIGGVPTGPRSVSWRPDDPATLVWTEALDGGDPEQEVPHRDRWLSLSSPFGGQPEELFRVEHRSSGLEWLAGGARVIAREYDRDRRWRRATLRDLNDASAPGVVLEDRSVRDRYADPGSTLRAYTASGRSVVRVDGDWIYRSGSGASEQGALPFLDRQNLNSGVSERLWRCEPGAYEAAVDVVHPSGYPKAVFITRHESKTEPPNYRLRKLGDERVESITRFADPTPQLRGIHKELVRYERADGVPLSATLYLPADYQKGRRLPLLVWAYPREFNDVKTAGQVSSSPWRFTRIAGTSHLHLLSQGYAILDGATMPVIGDPETMNDTFVEQIVAAAQAAIDKAVELGVADRSRVAVGGHSYGAFMTANLLAHCDLFRTGIARSGAYNRTLTPFGFQSERRTVWEAPEIYFSVSPFLHTQKINEPVLLIHGEADNNSGTYPMQSQRLFQAIKGNGGRARLVMLPYESHGYRARESVLHVLAEQIEWLERHLGVPEAAPADAGRR